MKLVDIFEKSKISQMFSVGLSRAPPDHPVVLIAQPDNFITLARLHGSTAP